MDKFIRLGATGLAALALFSLAQPALAECKVGKIAELPVTMSGLVPLVPAKINGADVMFIADSGAFYSIIWPSTASEQKLTLHATPFGYSVGGVGGTADTYYTTVKTFTLASTPIKDVKFLVAEGIGGDVAGIMGQNVLGIADVEYDLAHGAIRLMKPVDCHDIAFAYWSPNSYSTLNIDWQDSSDRRTTGVIFINGVKLNAVFDTGASVSMLTKQGAHHLGISMNDPSLIPAGVSIGIGNRLVKNFIFPVASLKIAEEEIRNTHIRVGDTEDTNTDMLLGADFFVSHRVYVANSQGKMYFTYNGGPVFNLTGVAKTQTNPDQPAQPSTITDLGPDPTDAEGYSRRGAALAARRDFDHALADLSRACEMAPAEPRYFLQRAQTRMMNQQPLLAMSDLDETLKLKPDDVDALVLRAELKLFEGDKAGAGVDLDAADHAAPKEADMRLRLGGLFESDGRLDAALVQFGLWITAHTDDAQMADALNGRCWVRTLSGQGLDLALKDCNHALRLRPNTAKMLDSRGLTFLRLGQFDKAVADYDAALALNPKLAWSLYGRGLAELDTGQKTQGQADIGAALALAPKLAEAAKGFGITATAAP